MALQQIDITTPQSNGKFGESARSANVKHNSNITEVGQRLGALEAATGGAGEAIIHLRADLLQEVQARQQVDESVEERLRTLGRNQIINGNFRFWQRGTSFQNLASGTYTADRWLAVSVNDVMSVFRAEHVAGDASYLGGSRYFARVGWSQAPSSDSLATYQHRIENGHRLLAGKTVTVSMWVRASAATRLGLELEQTFGSGGTPSSPVYVQAPLVTGVTGGWQRIVRTFTVPSIEGKTFGTTRDGYLGLILWMDAGANWDVRSSGVGRQTGEFQIADVQIEVGASVTGFESLPEALQLLLCQRYYVKSFAVDTPPAPAVGVAAHSASAAFNSATLRGVVAFPVPMRGMPSVKIYRGSEVGGGNDNSAIIFNPSAGAWMGSVVAATVPAIGQYGFSVDFASPFTLNPAGSYLTSYNYTADAEI